MEWIRGQVSPQRFQTWFEPIRPLELTQSRVLIEVPNPFFVDWFEQHSLSILRDGLKQCLGEPPAIQWRICPDYYEATEPESAAVGPVPRVPAPSPPRPSDSLNPRYVFESFVVGPSNSFSHAASVAVAAEPGRSYNPMFIYGATGLGKTHLMQAIGNALGASRPGCKIMYVSCERFTNEMIEAISQHDTSGFRERYRKLDVLLIDDIHFLGGRESTQEEFFHTFNALHDARKQIVVTSDRPPKEIRNIEVRLISRFTWGLVTEISPPDLETRMAILTRKAGDEGVHLPKDVAHLISTRVTTNIRVLEGCLVRLAALSRLLHAEISLELAEDVLKDLLDSAGGRRHSVEDIQTLVAHVFGVTPESLRGKRRTALVARARQVAMYLSRRHTHLTLNDIGRSFGHRDHSTVLHACGKIARLRVQDDQLERTLLDVESRLQRPASGRGLA
jgi:chromosomal replication initiator protein